MIQLLNNKIKIEFRNCNPIEMIIISKVIFRIEKKIIKTNKYKI